MHRMHDFKSANVGQRSRTIALVSVMATLIAALYSSLAPDALLARLQTQLRPVQLLEPQLPAVAYAYSDSALQANIPSAHDNSSINSIMRLRSLARPGDNTPATNPVTDHGATLGRVLFYDTRLSANNTTSCGSCHMQEFGFTDTARFSAGFNGERTKRHSMALQEARFYSTGRFFWDERAATLEDAVLMPIQDKIEMGMTLDSLVTKLQNTKFYAPLFTAAFGAPDVTSEKISRALAQFVRSMTSSPVGIRIVSFRSGDTTTLSTSGPIQIRNPITFSSIAAGGATLFRNQCAGCHMSGTLSIDAVHNTGLDSVVTDPGAGNGRFKAPSLRNVALRGPFMHDGRFKTLEEVVDFYNSGVKGSPELTKRFRRADSTVDHMNLTAEQKASLVAYMQTFTDQNFIADPRFSDPFRSRQSSVGNR